MILGRRIVIIGAGGHGKVVAETLIAMGTYEIAGFIDPALAGRTVLGMPVLGGDEVIPTLRATGIAMVFVALGDNHVRQRLGTQFHDLGFSLPTLVHPSAVVSPSTQLGWGVLVMPLAVINADARVGDMVIINSGSIVEHDCEIGAAAHIAPGCSLGGSVTVGERTLLGVGSSIRPNTRIGADVVVGAGAAVVADLPDGAQAFGMPARQR